MKLKYRIKIWTFLFAKKCYTAQYRILGIWLNINSYQVGRILKSGKIYCETFEEARQRIEKHKNNMQRANEISCAGGTVIWKQ